MAFAGRARQVLHEDGGHMLVMSDDGEVLWGGEAKAGLVLSTMMLPGILTMIPKFIMWRELDRVDTFTPLTVGAWFAWGPSFIFLLRQFFMTIPRDIEEAATLDGANVIEIFSQIMLPLVDLPLNLPMATTIVRAQSLGYAPGMAICH